MEQTHLPDGDRVSAGDQDKGYVGAFVHPLLQFKLFTSNHKFDAALIFRRADRYGTSIVNQQVA